VRKFLPHQLLLVDHFNFKKKTFFLFTNVAIGYETFESLKHQLALSKQYCFEFHSPSDSCLVQMKLQARKGLREESVVPERQYYTSLSANALTVGS
jgi:hypothetical protein